MKKCPFCAEFIQDEALKCRYCGSAITELGRSAFAVAAAPSTPPPRREVQPSLKRRNWWITLGVPCAAIGLSFYAASESPAAGVVLLLVAFVIVAAVIVGRASASAPAATKSISKALLRRPGWTFVLLGTVTFGAVMGIGDRAKRTEDCKERLAEAQRRTGGDSAVAFDDAAAACAKADLHDEQAQAKREASDIRAKVEAKKQAERQQNFAAALADAKSQSAKPGAASAAVTSFRRAISFGQLDADSSKLYAAQLREHGKTLATSNDLAGALNAFEEAKQRNPQLDGIDQLLSDTRTAKAQADAKDAVDKAIETAKYKCDSADELKAAFTSIRGISKGEPQFERARTTVASLERCRKNVYRQLGQVSFFV